MKNFIKFFGTAIFGLVLSANVFAQSATATAGATIVGPISISKDVDMDFGNVAVNTNPGTVILDPDGTRSSTGGVTLPAVTGTVTAASFTVSGVSGYTYAITLPLAATTISFGAITMTVDNWTSTPTVALGGTLTGGTETLNVGATLNVAGSQAAGTYLSAIPFTVTVNYN